MGRMCPAQKSLRIFCPPWNKEKEEPEREVLWGTKNAK